MNSHLKYITSAGFNTKRNPPYLLYLKAGFFSIIIVYEKIGKTENLSYNMLLFKHGPCSAVDTTVVAQSRKLKGGIPACMEGILVEIL